MSLRESEIGLKIKYKYEATDRCGNQKPQKENQTIFIASRKKEKHIDKRSQQNKDNTYTNKNHNRTKITAAQPP